MKLEQTGCSETSAYKIQTPGNYPEENIQQTEEQLLAAIPGTKQLRYYLNDQPLGSVTDRRTVC